MKILYRDGSERREWIEGRKGESREEWGRGKGEGWKGLKGARRGRTGEKGGGGLSLSPLCPRILCCADMVGVWAGEGKR